MVLAMLPATAMAAGNTDPTPTPKKPVDRYTVLVLDHSGSMWGTPIRQLKVAAKRFCDAVLADNVANNGSYNKVAILGFSTEPDKNAQFTDERSKMETAINALEDDYLTDIAAALLEADRLLKTVGESTDEYDVVKNIVLLSDGLPETEHPDESNGRYSGINHWAVPQANRCYRLVSENGLLTRYNVYSLGFFHDMDKDNADFCRKVLMDLQNSGFYEVDDPSKLDIVFGEFISDDILGEDPPAPGAFDPNADRTVITIACPVDVTVTVGSEKVSSAGKDIGTTMIGSYGKMEILNGDEGTVGTKKILTLTKGYSYTINVASTGAGKAVITTAQYAANSGTPVAAPQTQTYEFTAANQSIPSWKVIRTGSTQLPPENSVDDGIINNGPQIGDTVSHFTYVPTVTGGTVVLSKRNAEPGDWVNIYVTPDEGYKLESLTVTDMRGWPVTVREMGENAFSFTMPNARINVNPVFVKVEEDDLFSTNVPDTIPDIPNVDGTSPNYGSMVINTAAMNYSDVNAGDWFYNNVKFCHERYLLNNTGEADGKFEPNTASTRATVWTALSRLAGRNTITQGDNWYDRAQIWAKGKGITDGERPMDSMTREEFVTMLWRYDGNKYVQNNALGQFNDGTSVSWWATEAVKWAVATGLLNGSNGSLNPQSNVTRAEVAAVLQRYVQSVH